MNIRTKLVLFVVSLAVITYSTSALFIHWVHPTFFPRANVVTFELITYGLGIIWSGIFAAIFSGFFTKPLSTLKQSAERVADHQIGRDVELPPTNDEIRAVSESFQHVVESLRQIVRQIDRSVAQTTSTAKSMADSLHETS